MKTKKPNNNNSFYTLLFLISAVGVISLAALILSIISFIDTNNNNNHPTPAPTLAPTFAPSSSPTFPPTSSPTFAPSSPPTISPTSSPTFPPTLPPTEAPEPPFNASQIIFVNKGGDDSTCTGADELPCLTIGFAMSLIQDASASKRYLISIGPGIYSENVNLKANVWLSGSSIVATRINSLDINDPSWTVIQDSRSGIKTLQILGTTTIDYVSVQGQEGKVYIQQSRLSGDLIFTAANSINEVLLYNCELQGNYIQTGGDLLWYASTIFGNIIIHDQDGSVGSPVQQIDTRAFMSSGGFVLPLDGSTNVPTFTIINDIPSIFTHQISVNLAGFTTIGNLTITGDGVSTTNTNVYATVEGIPPNTIVNNNGNLELLTQPNAIGYIPTTISNWNNIQPVNVQNALDRIAAFLGPIP